MEANEYFLFSVYYTVHMLVIVRENICVSSLRLLLIILVIMMMMMVMIGGAADDGGSG